MTVDDIDWSCPADLEPYAKAHNLEIKEKDSFIHAVCGAYVLSAVSVGVEHGVFGKKAKSTYIDKPILQTAERKSEPEEKELSEEEKKRKTEQLFMKLRIMGANFNLNHKDGRS